MKFPWMRLFGCCLMLGVAAPALATVILSVGSQTVTQGNLATLDVNISGLGNGTALGGFDLNVGFDPSLLSFSSATYGDPILGDQLNIEGFGTITSTVPGTGTTELTELSFDSPAALTSLQASNFTLAALTFDALSPGVSPVALSVNALADQNGNSISAETVNGSISVETSGGVPTVPEPSTWLLFCGGLLILGGCRKKTKIAGG